MKVQLITKGKSREFFPDIVVSNISAPRSLDEFEVNIIDLSSSRLWVTRGGSTRDVEDIKDFESIQTMVDRKKNAKIVYVMPQNVNFQICYGNTAQKNSHVFPLKDNLPHVCYDIIPRVLPSNIPKVNLIYENTRTTISGKEFIADFYFDTSNKEITKSDYSDKPTTIELSCSGVYVTTLKISDTSEELLHFLGNIVEEKKKQNFPEWISSICFGDDNQQKDLILQKQAEIEAAERTIEEADQKLEENMRYKSILATNGEELVEVIFDILQQLLQCDLSEFVDKKEEDFLIKTEDCTLIGEIKGVTSNVKNDHIGQIEHHYQRYMDELEELGLEEKVNQILIINPFRTKNPEEREPIHERQIKLAERNGCLIIETLTLLRLFEAYQRGDITPAKCIEMFCGQTGLLKYP